MLATLDPTLEQGPAKTKGSAETKLCIDKRSGKFLLSLMVRTLARYGNAGCRYTTLDPECTT